jgi:hypothetical protein
MTIEESIKKYIQENFTEYEYKKYCLKMILRDVQYCFWGLRTFSQSQQSVGWMYENFKPRQKTTPNET